MATPPFGPDRANWGLEYTIRELRLAQSVMEVPADADELAERFDVFMLSSAGAEVTPQKW